MAMRIASMFSLENMDLREDFGFVVEPALTGLAVLLDVFTEILSTFHIVIAWSKVK